MWVLRADGNSVQGNIIGCAKAVVNKNTQIVKLGPVAVRPNFQVCPSQISVNSGIIRTGV